MAGSGDAWFGSRQAARPRGKLNHSEIWLALILLSVGFRVFRLAVIVVDCHEPVDQVLLAKETLGKAACVEGLLAIVPVRPRRG